MKPFTMTGHYVDPETGEWVTETVLIDDFPYADATEWKVPCTDDDENPEYPW